MCDQSRIVLFFEFDVELSPSFLIPLSSIMFTDEAFKSHDSRAHEHFKQSTVGLVSAEEFRRRRLEAEEQAQVEEKEK